MNTRDPLQQAVMDAAAEFEEARDKLTRAETAYNQSLRQKSTTWNAVDKNKQKNFSAASPDLTDC